MPEKFTKVSFYIVAHADDWQLFMQPNVYKDLQSFDTKVVFIITTGGDAGFNKKFWSAREEGMKSSLRFCLAPISTIKETTTALVYNSHLLNCTILNHVKCYFLRLPDGNIDGNGFKKNRYQSLSRFKLGQLNNITAVDNSATYLNWEDLHATLEQIILSENSGISDTWIHYLDADTIANPGDHADHIGTGLSIQAMPIISSVTQAKYVGYSMREKIQPLLPTDLFWKAGMFAAYEKAVFDSTGYSTLKEDVDAYVKWSLSSASFVIVLPRSTF